MPSRQNSETTVVGVVSDLALKDLVIKFCLENNIQKAVIMNSLTKASTA